MKISMENLFNKCNLSIENMEENKPYNIEDKNIKLLAYDFESKTNKYKTIKYLVFKGVHDVWEAVAENGEVLLRGKHDHKVWDSRKKDFFKFEDMTEGYGLLKTGEEVYFNVRKTNKKEPIVDLQIEDKNYYTNEILSHNTVFHSFLGQQIEDWQATKNYIRKVFENSKIPYLTISPVYSICSVHGYLQGKQERCPLCRDEQIKAYKKKLNELKKKKAELELI